MLDTSTRIKAIREAGQVRRTHAKQMHREYNVGIHTYNMLGMLTILYPEAPAELYKTITWHDAPERWTGDLPTPLKKFIPEIRERLKTFEKKMLAELTEYTYLTPEDELWVKALDMLELYLWSKEEMAMGNTAVNDMKRECQKILDTMSSKGLLPANVLFYYLEVREEMFHTFLSDVPERVFSWK